MRQKILLALFVCLSGFAQAQLKPFYSASTDKYGYKDSQGKIVIQPVYDFAWEFREGMSAMKLNGKYGFISEIGVEVVPPLYEYAGMFSDGLSVVKTEGKYGFIDKSGKMVVPAIYDRADNFHGDRANVSMNKKWSVMIYSPKSAGHE
jgi:hypothetical protein